MEAWQALEGSDPTSPDEGSGQKQWAEPPAETSALEELPPADWEKLLCSAGCPSSQLLVRGSFISLVGSHMQRCREGLQGAGQRAESPELNSMLAAFSKLLKDESSPACQRCAFIRTTALPEWLLAVCEELSPVAETQGDLVGGIPFQLMNTLELCVSLLLACEGGESPYSAQEVASIAARVCLLLPRLGSCGGETSLKALKVLSSFIVANPSSNHSLLLRSLDLASLLQLLDHAALRPRQLALPVALLCHLAYLDEVLCQQLAEALNLGRGLAALSLCLSPSSDEALCRDSLLLLCQLLRHNPSSVQPVLQLLGDTEERLLQTLGRCLACEQSSARSAGCRLVGLLANCAGPVFSDSCARRLVPTLSSCLGSENETLTQNALFALASIFCHCESCCGLGLAGKVVPAASKLLVAHRSEEMQQGALACIANALGRSADLCPLLVEHGVPEKVLQLVGADSPVLLPAAALLCSCCLYQPLLKVLRSLGTSQQCTAVVHRLQSIAEPSTDRTIALLQKTVVALK